MALITCPDCGNQYDDSLASCPNCGRPNPAREAPRNTAGGAGAAGNAGAAGGPYGGPAGGAYTPPPGYGAGRPDVPNYLVWSILVTIFTCLTCCIPIGGVALFFSIQVNNKLQAGDVAGAMQASKNAKLWCWIAFAIGAVWFVIAMILGVMSAILGELSTATQY